MNLEFLTDTEAFIQQMGATKLMFFFNSDSEFCQSLAIQIACLQDDEI